jgi:hypothetical protein
MALSDKNIKITPNTGSASADPSLVFTGGGTSSIGIITAKVYPLNSGTLSFEGTSGQLFSITNTMVGSIFSVNDISGIPSIEVLDTGVVRLAQFGGNVGIGIAAPTSKLHVKSDTADGATAVAAVIDTSATWANIGCRLLSIRNGGAEMAWININGRLYATGGANFNAGLSVDTIGTSGAAPLTLYGQSADGASAIGVILNNSNVLATAGAKLLSIRNATVEKAYISKDGVAITRAVGDTTTTITYSASMTPDASLGGFQTIVVNTAVAFTINAPTNGITGQYLAISMANTSGGVLGAATWNAAYKMSAWTNPATGFNRTITFRYNGTNWVEVSRTPADVPN